MIDRAFTVALPGDAMQVAALFCVDPVGTGGVVLRGCSAPQRDAWVQLLGAWLPDGAALRSVPLNIEEDRLLGGLDLAATLASGRPVARQGVLAEADGGVLLLNSADRASERCAAHLAAVLDTRQIATERHGVAIRRPCRVGVVAFDTGVSDDERPSARLLDRLSFHLDFETLPIGAIEGVGADWSRADLAAARTLLPAVEIDAELREAVCEASIALGIESMRAPLLTLRVACASAALQGRVEVSADDAALAVRLVLGPRATAFPCASAQDDTDTDTPKDNEADHAPQRDAPAMEAGASDPPADPASADAQDAESQDNRGAVADILLQAAAARLPRGLLDALKAGRASTLRSQRAGRVGAAIKGALRGRPDGVHAGDPRGGARLNLIETLRAAAPWQTLRKAETAARAGVGTIAVASAVQVRREDFRVTRFKQRSETTTVFAVDASGSAALQRLAEAKGAVELMLADCYVRRDSVSLIAFRGQGAQVLLPPTRSLVRAKRSLAGLAGGGGTPLATAIDATLALAQTTRRHGRTPVAVLLTDGRANVARDGSGGRERATTQALESARRLRAAGITALVLDTSLAPQQPARDLAAEMGAVYLPLPHADAASLSRVMRSASQLGGPGRRSTRP